MATAINTDTVVGVFSDEATAQAVVADLVGEGFKREDIRVNSGQDITSNVASGNAGLTGRAPEEHHSGGIMGWLESLFGGDSEHEDRHHYSEIVRRGNCIVAVDTDSANADRVAETMNRHDAIDIDQHAQGYQQTTSDVYDRTEAYDRTTPRAEGVLGATDQAIPVVREELQVGKRTVKSGGVRVYSRITQEPVQEQVTLRDEKVRVERRPANREATAADINALHDQTIEVTETTEEPVVSKRRRVVEEVLVGKETTERSETVRDTLQHSDVEVEHLGAERAVGVGTTSDYSTDFRRDFETRYAGQGGAYETYQPAYDFGSRYANNPQYSGRSFDDLESELKTDYLRNNPTSTWDRMRGAVRYGWERATGKR